MSQEEANRKRSESVKRAWAEGKGAFAGKKKHRNPCKCGELAGLYADFVHGHNSRGVMHSDEWKKKQSDGVREAHKKGVYNGKLNPAAPPLRARSKRRRPWPRSWRVPNANAAVGNP